MGRRLTRKQIKHDDFVTLVDRGMHWMGQNWRRAALGFGGAIGLALLWWAATALLASRGTAAARALDEAITTYQTPVGAAVVTGEGAGFATDSARLDAADAAFKRVASRYRLTSQARLARLYQARVALDRGDADRALSLLSDLASRKSDDVVARMATLDLVRLRLARSEGYQVAADLEKMAAGRDPRLPRDLALFLLAEVRAQEGKHEEAARLYRKLGEDFPESPYRYEAQQRLTAAS